MTKSKSAKKSAAKLARREMATELAVQGATGLANVARGAAKKKKKKSAGSKFLNFLSGAAQIAAQVAPVVLPAILAKHGPTRAAMSSGAGSATSSSAVGIAEPVAMQPMTGLTDIAPILEGGKVVGVRYTGLDYITEVVVGGQGIVAGSVLNTIDLNPRSADWAGTRIAREMTLWTRYRFVKLAMMFEPSTPTTTAGQLIAAINTDAAEPFVETGRAAIQRLTAMSGAEMGQVWQMVLAGYNPDTVTQDFYADDQGSDVRLISPGVYRLAAATDLDTGTIGAIYAAYSIEFRVAQLEDTAGNGGAFAYYSDPPQYDNLTPFTADVPPPLDAASSISGAWVNNSSGIGPATAGVLLGLPKGTYWLEFHVSGSTTDDDMSAFTITATGAGYALNLLNQTLTLNSCNSFWFLRVTADPANRDPDQGGLVFSWTGSPGTPDADWLGPIIMGVQCSTNFFGFGGEVTRAVRGTLQGYEAKVDALTRQVDQLKRALIPRLPTIKAGTPDRSKQAPALMVPPGFSSALRALNSPVPAGIDTRIAAPVESNVPLHLLTEAQARHLAALAQRHAEKLKAAACVEVALTLTTDAQTVTKQ